jgi:hypothetical protein
VKNRISIPCRANEVICDASCLTPPGFIAQVEALSPAAKKAIRCDILSEVGTLARPWRFDWWVFAWFFLKEVLTPN